MNETIQGQGANPFAYQIIRYMPNLVRDEWVNIGVVIHDPANGRFRVRLVEEESEFARIRRLHPAADENLLRGFGPFFEDTLGEHRGELAAWVAKLGQTLSSSVQLSPQTGLLAEDMDTELERLYASQVAPHRARATATHAAGSRSEIRAKANQIFRTAGLWQKLERSVRVGSYTFPGDPLRLDYTYRRNGTRGFIHSLALSRDPAQAKVLAYTADAIRAKTEKTEFAAVTEVEPRPEGNERHQFVTGLLREKKIQVVPLSRLPAWAYQLRPLLQ